MNTHSARRASVLAVLAGGLLLAAPAGARGTTPGQPPPIVGSTVCSLPWTNLVVGTAQADNLVGTSANDLIIGYGGDDTIDGLSGRDTILGGDGADVITGGPGNDCIDGGPGADDSVLYYYTQPNGTDASYSVSFRYSY